MKNETARREIESLDYYLQNHTDDYSEESHTAMMMAIKALEQESCEDVAKERYEDLCEYFGGAKDILKHREDFKAWLGRVKWHIHKAEELSAENDDLRDQLAMRDRFKQEPSGDLINRRGTLEPYKILDDTDTLCVKSIRANILQQPPVNPTKTGHWIYKQYGGYPEQGNYHCSECDKIDNRIPTYCPSCGAKMVEPQESEG